VALASTPKGVEGRFIGGGDGCKRLEKRMIKGRGVAKKILIKNWPLSTIKRKTLGGGENSWDSAHRARDLHQAGEMDKMDKWLFGQPQREKNRHNAI